MVGSRRALVLVCVMTAPSAADPKPPTVEEAIKTASAAKKPLVIEFFAQWCGPCKTFEQNVLPSPFVQTALADVIWVRYDAEDSPGTEAAMRYQVDAFPTILVVDASGVVRSRNKGLLDEAMFIDLLHDAKTQIEDEAAIRAELHARPKDPTVHMRAARWFAEHDMLPDAISHYRCVASDKTAATFDRDEATTAADHLHRIDVWRHDLVADKIAQLRASPASATFDDLAIATIGSPLTPGEQHKLFASVFAAQQDLAKINTLIYVALAAGAKDEALAASRTLEKNTDVGTQGQYLDTRAECHHAVGDRATALSLEDEALKLALPQPMEETLKRNRARFDTTTADADEVIQLRARMTDMWKRLGTADHLPAAGQAAQANAMINNSARSAAMAAWQKSWDAEKALASTAATACAKEAGKTELAVVQVDIDVKTGAVTPTKILTEAGTPKLGACITKALRGTTLPVMQNRPKREIRIQFAHP